MRWHLTLSHSTYISDAWDKYSPHIPNEKRSVRSVPLTSELAATITKAGPNPTSEYNKERHHLYRSILGTLGHCANFTHPEIAFAISFASQFMSNPSEAHLQMILIILCYLWGARTKHISLRRRHWDPRRCPIVVLCDADLSNSASKRSRTGWAAYLFGNLVGWNSRLQPSVSLSTAEAEYMAITSACQFAV